MIPIVISQPDLGEDLGAHLCSILSFPIWLHVSHPAALSACVFFKSKHLAIKSGPASSSQIIRISFDPLLNEMFSAGRAILGSGK